MLLWHAGPLPDRSDGSDAGGSVPCPSLRVNFGSGTTCPGGKAEGHHSQIDLACLPGEGGRRQI